jgi:hypothetical protein
MRPMTAVVMPHMAGRGLPMLSPFEQSHNRRSIARAIRMAPRMPASRMVGSGGFLDTLKNVGKKVLGGIGSAVRMIASNKGVRKSLGRLAKTGLKVGTNLLQQKIQSSMAQQPEEVQQIVQPLADAAVGSVQDTGELVRQEAARLAESMRQKDQIEALKAQVAGLKDRAAAGASRIGARARSAITESGSRAAAMGVDRATAAVDDLADQIEEAGQDGGLLSMNTRYGGLLKMNRGGLLTMNSRGASNKTQRGGLLRF